MVHLESLLFDDDPIHGPCVASFQTRVHLLPGDVIDADSAMRIFSMFFKYDSTWSRYREYTE